ncbi:uroporphyrinogen decarboxylase [Rhodopirellula sp. MGV]|uniref:uroporphyrinogen decarboxylase n=1 Tax=Rhodopirellula sp. MGV TaxID=2023130 RepID=UPI000B978C13|nr:uroporphyrinogen decarboxylase [Rhodopirellula sp. MGV]OYP28915.1 uroporphyrinogen decarboxylase [Rhodopirellula sp. MGV]PNY36969.1 uroporphyrinogen decarboxylase [Rhodopirellula baltica]
MSVDADFSGLHVASLESRRASEMERLIQRYGGVAHVSPSMREVPIEPNREAIDFAYRVITGEIGIVVFMTGVGFRFLVKAIEKHVDTQRFIDALSDITTICRGPKPVAAMRELGIQPTHRVGEPNTWREILQYIDHEKVQIANQVIGLQEYGISNASLIAGLEARGAIVSPVRVYGWEFPEQTDPLRENIQALADGKRDILLLTSAHQIVNMMRMAEQMGVSKQLRQGLRSTAIISIGPTTTQMLNECDLQADMEPSHPKMGHLVVESARQSASLIAQKRRWRQSDIVIQESKDMAIENVDASQQHPSVDSLFMKACRGEATERTPIWLMRQAGRYMAEYREVRANQSFLELCYNPKLCSEVMCTAVDRLGVDAAIIFSDLLPLLEPLGFDLEFVAGDGPVIHNPIREEADIDRLKRLEDPQSLGFVYETVRQTRKDLPEHLPVIGFSGSPFTLASYAIEGGGSKVYMNTKKLMYASLSSPSGGAWAELMATLTEAVTVYLNHQIAAGAQCVQLFDSWAGCLSPSEYTEFVLPWMDKIISGIAPGVPVINFATGNPELLPLLRGDRRTVVGVDWRISLRKAWDRIGHDKSVQGNLDPAVLLGEPELIRKRAAALLDTVKDLDGHIFNLGHGVLKETPVENAIALVESVKELSAK